VQQDFAFVTPVLLDSEAREKLTAANATCVIALDEAVRCVTESKVFTAHWVPTSQGAKLLPEAMYVTSDLRVYDIVTILNAVKQGATPNFVDDTIDDLVRQIMTTVDADNWAVNGGDLNRMQVLGTYLVVAAPIRTQIGIQRLLASMDHARP
jgi:hypothetical protein